MLTCRLVLGLALTSTGGAEPEALRVQRDLIYGWYVSLRIG